MAGRGGAEQGWVAGQLASSRMQLSPQAGDSGGGGVGVW